MSADVQPVHEPREAAATTVGAIATTAGLSWVIYALVDAANIALANLALGLACVITMSCVTVHCWYLSRKHCAREHQSIMDTQEIKMETQQKLMDRVTNLERQIGRLHEDNQRLIATMQVLALSVRQQTPAEEDSTDSYDWVAYRAGVRDGQSGDVAPLPTTRSN